MTSATREIFLKTPGGEVETVTLILRESPGEVLAFDEGDAPLLRAQVLIDSPSIAGTINAAGMDYLQLMYRALWLTGSFLFSEAKRIGGTLFQVEPGDVADAWDIFKI